MLRPPRLLVPLTSLLSEEQRGLLLPSFPPFSHLKWKSDITTRPNGKTTVIGLSPISIDRFMGCDRGSITQLLYSLSTLHTGNCFPTCKTRFRLLTRLYRAGHFHPARFLLKVSAQGHSPLPDLSWRNMYNLSNFEGVRPLWQGVDRAGDPLPEHLCEGTTPTQFRPTGRDCAEHCFHKLNNKLISWCQARGSICQC